MKVTVFRLFVSSFTLVLGILSSWFVSSIPEAGNVEVDGIVTLKTRIAVRSDPRDPLGPYPYRFTEKFRICKPGYVQGYITNDGQEVSEGNGFCNLDSNEATKSEFETRIKNAKRIIEEKDGRVVLEIETGNKSHFEILEYDGSGYCIRFYHATTLDLLLEFERWNESNMLNK